MIKRFIFLLCASLLLATGAIANLVTVQDAQTVALNFFKQKYQPTAGRVTPVANLMAVKTHADGTVLYYVFDMAPAKGFVIVSATDNDNPIIGYSVESPFKSITNIGMNEYLNRWSEELHYSAINNFKANSAAPAMWQALRTGNPLPAPRSSGVQPLCTTTWAQSNQTAVHPVTYNLDCPYDYTYQQNAITGCVATAMAQIMKYWNYPAYGTGTASYYDETSYGFSNDYGYLSYNFSTSPFNWANMPDNLDATTTNAQDSAVAALMYACGVSVKMDYGVFSSGSYVISTQTLTGASAQSAFTTYFKYNPNTVQGLSDSNYSSSAWQTMVENELNNGRPVLYGGFDPYYGGHAWVCDGYDVDNMMHMNWGWDGLDDGFYALTNLDPSVYFFSYNFTMIIGIEPDIIAVASPPNICSGSNATLSVSGTSGSPTYNWSPSTGLSCTTCASPTASPTSTTTYTVSVTSGGVTNISSVTVNVLSPGHLTYFLSDSELCEGNSAYLRLPGLSGITISPSSSVVWYDSAYAYLTPDTTTAYNITSSSSACGSGESGQVTVHVTTHSPVTVNLTNNPVCSGSAALLSVTGLSSITLSPNDGTWYMIDSGNYSLDPYYSESYTVSGVTSCGSAFTRPITVTVISGGSLGYTLNKSTICRGDTAVLTILDASSVTISPSGSAISAGSNTYLLIPTTTTTYYVSGYNSACAENGSLDLTLQVLGSSSLDYTPTSIEQCGTSSYTDVYVYGVTSVNFNPPVPFFWMDSTDGYALVYPDTTTNYIITAKTVCGNTDTASLLAQITPTAGYTLSRSTLCGGDTALLTIVGMRDIYFESGSAYTEIDSAHYLLYPSTSTYYYFEGYDCSGYYTEYEPYISVVTSSGIQYTVEDSNLCSGYSTSVYLYGVTSASLSPYTYLYWTDSTDAYAYLYPTTTTTYTITANTVCAVNQTATFTVYVSASSTYQLSTNSICSGDSAIMTVQGITGIQIYPDSGYSWIDAAHISFKPATTTYYTFYGQGCNGEVYDYFTINVNPSNGINVMVEDSELCSGSETYVTFSGATNMSLTPFSTLFFLDSTDYYSYLDPTTTTTYTISGTSSCTGQQVSTRFTVYILSNGYYTISSSTICPGDSATVTFYGLEDISISPLVDEAYNGVSTAYLYPSSNTTYTINAYSTCTFNSFQQQIPVTVTSPHISATTPDTVICALDTTQICASPGFLTYWWNTGQSGQCISATLPGYYTVAGVDSNNCHATSSPLYINVLSEAGSEISVHGDTLYAAASSSYQWYFNGEPIQGATSNYVVMNRQGQGVYTVLLTGSNGCKVFSNSYGTSGISSIAGNNILKIYPNPTQTSWMVLVNDEWIGSNYRLYDSEGRLVYSGRITGNQNEISADLAPGLYTIRVMSENASTSARLVKL